MDSTLIERLERNDDLESENAAGEGPRRGERSHPFRRFFFTFPDRFRLFRSSSSSLEEEEDEEDELLESLSEELEEPRSSFRTVLFSVKTEKDE